MTFNQAGHHKIPARSITWVLALHKARISASVPTASMVSAEMANADICGFLASAVKKTPFTKMVSALAAGLGEVHWKNKPRLKRTKNFFHHLTIIEFVEC